MSFDTFAVTPPSAGKLFTGLLVLVAVSVYSAERLTYSQKEFVSGYLQVSGGELRVTAPMRGRVEFKVSPAGVVAQGDAIAVVYRNENTPAAGASIAVLRELNQSKVDAASTEHREAYAALNARKQALLRQRSFAVDTAEHAVQEVEARKKTLELEERRLGRQLTLQGQGMVSAAAIDQAHADVLSRRGEVQSAERSVGQARLQVASLDGDLNTLEADLAARNGARVREQVDNKKMALAVEENALQQVTAPRASKVTALAVSQGDSVEQGQLLAKLTPTDSTLGALLLIPPSAIARVKPGQQLSLQLAAFPYQTYGLVKAQIERVDTSSLMSDDSSLRTEGVPAGTMVRKAYARVTFVPAQMGGMAALQGGMELRAAVEVERKSFLAWMTWPLLKHFK